IPNLLDCDDGRAGATEIAGWRTTRSRKDVGASDHLHVGDRSAVLEGRTRGKECVRRDQNGRVVDGGRRIDALITHGGGVRVALAVGDGLATRSLLERGENARSHVRDETSGGRIEDR